MDNAVKSEPPLKQPGNETIDRLSFAIQRQSAMCMEFVRNAVEAERAQCAEIAEAETRASSEQSAESAAAASRRIAEKIRARAGQVPFVTTVKVRAAQ